MTYIFLPHVCMVSRMLLVPRKLDSPFHVVSPLEKNANRWGI